jgi:hypothetical protein
MLSVIVSYKNGFEDGEDIIQIDAPMSELRWDGTANNGQIQKFSSLLLEVFFNTFANTSFHSQINEFAENNNLQVKMSIEISWEIYKKYLEFFKKLIQKIDELPLREGIATLALDISESKPIVEYSNFYKDVIDLCICWFDYATSQLHERIK